MWLSHLASLGKVTCNGFALRFASPELQADKEVARPLAQRFAPWE